MTEQPTTIPFDLDQALLALLNHIQALMPCDSSALHLYDPESRMLIPHAYLGGGGHVVSSIPLGRGVIGEAGETRQPVMIADMTADSRCVFTDPDSRSELAVPVLFEDTLLGVFNVESHQRGAYTDHHLAILRAMADQAALLLHTAQQYEKLAGSHDTLLTRVQTHRQETQVLQRLAAIGSPSAGLDEMLIDKVRETAQLLDCEGAQLWLPNYVTYSLDVHAPSLYGIAMNWSTEPMPLDGTGYLVRVLHTGQSHVSHVPPLDAGIDCRNVQAYPLNTHHRTLGVLHLINQKSDVYDDDQIELGQSIADQIAVAINSVQMFAAERRRTEMLTQVSQISQELYAILDPPTLLRKTAGAVYGVLGREAVYIFLMDDNGQTIQIAAHAVAAPTLAPRDDLAVPITSGIVGRTIRSGQTQIVPDVRDDPDYVPVEEPRRLQSSLSVPLRRGDQVIGAINALSTQLNAFDQLERDALEMLAVQVGTALQNAQLYHEAQRRLVEQRVVYQIGQDLTAILAYPDLVEAMVQHMNRALDTSACMVGRYEATHRTLRIEADYRAPHHLASAGPLLTGAYLPLDENVAIDDAIRTRQAVTIYADDPDAAAAARALLDEIGDHAQLTVPMIKASNVLGAVTWYDQRPGRRFSDEDIQLARTLVAQATIALDNALLFGELEAHAHQLAEANQLRTQFLATISHELRTPMNSIIGFTEMLLDGIYGDLTERQLSRMDRIRENAYHLLTLIDDLLDLSNIEAGRMALHLELVGIGDSILTVMQTLEPDATVKGLALAYHADENLPRIHADPQRLHQIISNLLSNAIKFTHTGGVTITCRTIEQRGQLYVQTAVADTGIGISEAHREIIFDEFRQVDGSSTRAYGGTGMGLALTKKLIEMMGGTIWVESELNRGSTFTFLLPVAARTVSS
jgi:signal transduction histidine kinase/putative methionine-R-sulfoxide reductase with GAF domain